MKKNLWSKIIILIVMFFFVMPTLSPAQELSKIYEFDDNIEIKAANNILPQQLIIASSSVEAVVGEKLDSIEVVDQQQTSSSGQGCPFFSYLWIAQGFIPSLETLTKVEVKLFKGGNPTSPIIISIRNSLSGSDLTSVSIDGSLVSEYSKWIDFNFPDINVTPGNEYYIVCRSSGGSMINYYCAVFDINNPYGGGEAWGSINYGANWELIEDYYPQYPEPDACFKTYCLDESPNTPMISGEPDGNAGTEYTYTFSTTDPEGHDLYYYVKWGDDTTSEWIGEYASGETVSLKHIWQEQGTYTIEAKAKDIYGAEGNWGELTVTMPKNKLLPNSVILRLIERFQNAFPVLRQLLVI